MDTEYFGYIKVTRTGKFRGIIATVHDTDEPDGDCLLYTQFESPFFHDFDEACNELKKQCEDNDIPYSTKPIRATMMGVWKSQVTD